MELSIVTPTIRPLNLPAVYASILEMNNSKIEWIILFDKGKRDERIKKYESFVPIIIDDTINRGNAPASNHRNKGLDLSRGKWIYFLDDDTIIHPNLLNEIKKCDPNNDFVLIFNQYGIDGKKRINDFIIKPNQPYLITGAQIVVSKKYKYIKWTNNRNYAEECDYLEKIDNEIGYEKIKFINKCLTYRNYLRRYET